jgi:hypothetical protein
MNSGDWKLTVPETAYVCLPFKPDLQELTVLPVKFLWFLSPDVLDVYSQLLMTFSRLFLKA